MCLLSLQEPTLISYSLTNPYCCPYLLKATLQTSGERTEEHLKNFTMSEAELRVYVQFFETIRSLGAKTIQRHWRGFLVRKLRRECTVNYIYGQR